jgi:hypothetical protein
VAKPRPRTCAAIDSRSKTSGAKASDEWTEYDKKVEDGKKEADKLTRRFGPWYYVIDQALFAKLKPARTDLVKEKTAAPVEPVDPTKGPGK